MNIPKPLCCSLAIVSAIILNLFSATNAHAQEYFFHHLDKEDGLYDGTIRALAQDKFGYIWIGTQSGLYRYNSCGITAFLPDINDSTSAPDAMVTGILCDHHGELLIGTVKGIYQFDYSTNKFIRIKGSEEFNIRELKLIGNKYIIGYSNKGPLVVNPATNSFFNIAKVANDEILNHGVTDGCLYKNSLFISTDQGLIEYDVPTKKKIGLIKMHPDMPGVTTLQLDSNGILWAHWIYRVGILYKIDLNTRKIETIDVLQRSDVGLIDQIICIFVDSKNRLWVSTSWKGLILFDAKDNTFKSFTHQPASIHSSIAANHTRNIFEDDQGNLWVGTEGYGVNYFNPDAPTFDLFEPAFPQNHKEPVWCRAVTIDHDGQTWLGTGEGIQVLSPAGTTVAHYQNTYQTKPVLQSNSIRSMLCDHNGDIWIGTAAGINKYIKNSHGFEFYNQADSLPRSFFWTIIEDHQQRIWFGSRDGLFFKNSNDIGIHSIRIIKGLSKYYKLGVRSLFEDKRKNLWIGLNGSGLLFYNPKKDTSFLFIRNFLDTNGIIGNTITSIAEDNDGYIWFSTTTGVSRYDYATNQFSSYNHRNGLSAIKTSCLQVDSKNRIWIGTTAGLYVLEPDHKTFTIYNTGNGLPNVEFNDQSSFKWAADQFVYPTLGGYIHFNPEDFKVDTNNINFYISDFKVSGESRNFTPSVEEQHQINLKSDENFFSIELAAINYQHPGQAWYAYQLEGVNQDWIYTQDRMIDFTDIPGGNYTFRYKATNDINNWNVQEKRISLHIDTVFYQSQWFVLMIVAIISLIGYWALRFRYKKQAQILKLEGRSQLLEKENAIAQYENLKQQLNPHLLFNTISSINSLVKTNSKIASEYLEKMSRIYRYILQHSDRNLVLLQEELNFVQNYISLQHIRFSEGLKIHVNIHQESGGGKIVPVTLQNLIENAIKHNIVDEDSPLNIWIYTEDDYIVVKNNIQKKSLVETSNKQGLYNLILLYRYLSTKEIIIHEDSNFYTIKIPIL